MSFQSDINDFIKVQVPKQHAEVVGNVEDYVYNFVVLKAPRASGAFQANHHRTEGKPNYSFDKNITSNREPSPVKDDGFKKFFVANGAPYAKRLEEEWSTQGSHMFAVAYSSAKSKYGLS